MVVESLLMLSFHMKPKFTNFSVISREWQRFSWSIGCHLNWVNAGSLVNMSSTLGTTYYHLVTIRKSKFDLISDWKTPLHGSSLLFFIGLCTFYNCFSPWFEMNIKPLRTLQRKCHRKAMFTSLWTKELLNLYQLCKTNLTTSPILVRFYSNKLVLLKTY